MIANRAEIAIRVLRAAHSLGIETVAVATPDDTTCLHTKLADHVATLPGTGVQGYLDIEAIVEAAVAADCDGLHPGYGFLAENVDLAVACEAAGITFIGPTPEQLATFGNKLEARALADTLGVPLVAATRQDTTLDQAQEFFAQHGPMMIKAVGGGGGRGMRRVTDADQLERSWQRCRSEAQAAFGHPAVYVESFFAEARHIEIQVVGDGSTVTHLGDRECTLQRQNQKVVEVAPSPSLEPATRRRLIDSALAMAEATNYRSLGTWEFLIDAKDQSRVTYLETNARVQVEHTVTEQITDVDIVQTQLQLAAGAALADLDLPYMTRNVDETATEIGSDRQSLVRPGFAVQVRVNTESMGSDGTVKPTGGTLTSFECPTGPGIRVDTFGYVGYTTNPGFDSLLAKVIVYSPRSYQACLLDAGRALGEFRIGGIETNIALLQALLSHPSVEQNAITTTFIGDNAGELVERSERTEQRYFEKADQGGAATALAGAKVDTTDPLAVLNHGSLENRRPQPLSQRSSESKGKPGSDEAVLVTAPLQGTIVSVDVAAEDQVGNGQNLIVMEAMKMEHEIEAPTDGIIHSISVSVGDTVFEGHPLLAIEPADVAIEQAQQAEALDPNHVRADLAQLFERRAYGLDENRPAAVAKRHGRGHRTARENVAQLVDDGTFVEYGRLMVAAQRRRRDFQDLLENTSGDGMVAGIGSVNGDLFDEDSTQTVVMSYDYMVLAGTQGGQNHRKKDRLFEIAMHNQLPVVLFAEGGGGRPGDTDGIGGSGLDCLAFSLFAGLSGLVPTVGITNGRCFAGNAVLLGCCDVIIATEGSNIGVGGPAMVEGGGLGIFTPEEIGPVDVQVPSGVIDLLVSDEAEATDVAKQYLSYFQGATREWTAPDQRMLRHIVPENRKRVYEMKSIVETLCDTESVLELRPGWGPGIITCLARIEGRPVGVVANNPHHLAGAIDADGGDKGARFMQLCDAHDIPLIFLCDTPGIMVGPEAEQEATVRHAARMFVTAASIDVPMMTLVTRKGYGLGAQAMAGGSFKATNFTVAWPTGEFGGMGLEGFVKLGYRKELEAIEDPEERLAAYEQRVARLYDMGKAVNTASYFEIDDVIDPAESRQWIATALKSASKPAPRKGKKRPMVDTW